MLAHLQTDPDTVMTTARANLARSRDRQYRDGLARRHVTWWADILDEGVDAVVAVLIRTDNHACELRHNSPFAGVLSQSEHQTVMQRFSQYWTRLHQP